MSPSVGPVTPVRNRFSTTTDASGYVRLNVAQRMKMAECLIHAIDETLHMLGKEANLLVYRYLEKRFGLDKYDIPTRPMDFSKGLSGLFGSTSKSLEEMILKRLHCELGISVSPTKSLNFVDCVRDLQAQVQQSEVCFTSDVRSL